MLISSLIGKGLIRGRGAVGRVCGVVLVTLAAGTTGALADSSRETAGAGANWIYRFGAPSATINTDLSNNYRPVSINRIGSNAHDVVAVQNTGVFRDPNPIAYYTQTESSLNSILSLGGRRLIDVEPYLNGTAVNFAAIAVDNTGAEARGWTWVYDRTTAGIDAHLAAFPTHRPIDLTAYTDAASQRRYSVVTVQNTGSERLTFGVYYDKAESEMRTALGDRLTGQRLTSLTMHSGFARRVSGIGIENDGTPWWFYTQLTGQKLADRIGSTGGRIISLERYGAGDGTEDLFAVVLINNRNALTTRVGERMRDIVDDNRGTTANVGLFMKEVGGAEFASLNADRAFEPASLMKTAHLAYAVDRFAAGAASPAETLLNDDISNPDECPLTGSPPGTSATETVDRVLRRMMERSDNNATREIQLRFGRTNINNYLHGPVGLAQSNINGTTLGCLDCNFVFNVLTPREICQLFERVADGTLFGGSELWKSYFYNVMEDSRDETTLTDPDRFDGAYLTMRQLIQQESAGLNLTQSELDDFTSRTYHVRKGGAYSLSGCPGSPAFHARSFGGWMRLPFKAASGVITDREFVGAVMVDFALNGTNASDANNQFPELFREQVRAALVSWDSACTTPSITNQPDNVDAFRGANVQFQVSTGLGVGPVTYTWFKTNVPVSNGVQPDGSVVSGATTRTLSIANVRGGGFYKVRLTKDCGTLDSGLALLRVFTCVPDFNGDGTLDADDLGDYITCYFSVPVCAQAEFNGDGSVNADDLGDYITSYFGGC